MKLTFLAAIILWASLANAAILHSMPGASHTLYLDIDGEPATQWTGYAVPAIAPYDGDVLAMWTAAANAYARPLVDGKVQSALDLDVTTAPAPDLIYGKTFKIIIGGDGAWTGQTLSGFTFVRSFYFGPLTSYVFPTGTGHNSTFDGDAVAHEAGHAFGLEHPAGGYVPGLYMGYPFVADPAWSRDDYSVLASELGVAAVPEPGVAVLMALVLRRNRRNARFSIAG